jgi:hypothetical protein
VTIEVSLDVMLKGIDLVADTAYLTLRGKMGYQDKLLGINRLDAYSFRFDTPNPPDTLARLKRLLATQTLFYNRNKHNFSLRCRWDGGELDEGVSVDHCHHQLSNHVKRTLAGGRPENLDSTASEIRVILQKVPVFRTEVVVEDLDPSVKGGLSQKLENELSTGPVVVTTLGTLWHLALRAKSRDEAEALTREIVVTQKRDRGFLLNPNYQGFRLIAVETMELFD